MFSMQYVSEDPLIVTFQMSAAACLNLGRSQNCVSGNGLSLQVFYLKFNNSLLYVLLLKLLFYLPVKQEHEKYFTKGNKLNYSYMYIRKQVSILSVNHILKSQMYTFILVKNILLKKTIEITGI